MDSNKTGNLLAILKLIGVIVLVAIQKGCLRLFLWTFLYYTVKILQLIFYLLLQWTGISRDQLSVKVSQYLYKTITVICSICILGQFLYHGCQNSPLGLLAVFSMSVQASFFIKNGVWRGKDKKAFQDLQEFKFLLNCESQDGLCPICLEKIEGNALQVKCGHQYHEKCLKTWIRIKPVCPSCRRSV